MSKISTLKKPIISNSTVKDFAEGATSATRAQTGGGKGTGAARAENAPTGQKSGLVPEGDVRLTANIRADLHKKLKHLAVEQRTTVGELIEQWIVGWK